MTLIDLSRFTEKSINSIEIYFYQNDVNQKSNYINMSLEAHIINNIENKLKNPKISNYKSYYMGDKIYNYELHNDNQYVISKNNIDIKNVKRIKRDTDLMIISYKIEKYHPYMFPCTNDIDYISKYTIKEYKINNRISVNIKTEGDIKTAYIEYRHSENVELVKINDIISKLLSRL